MKRAEAEVLDVFEKFKIIIRNTHVVYNSKRHGNVYVDKQAIYPHVDVISTLCREIAWQFQNDDIDVVIAPAMGGVTLCQWVAYHLNRFSTINVKALYATKVVKRQLVHSFGSEDFTIREDWGNLMYGKRVLIVDDIFTTGGTVRRMSRLVKKFGGTSFGLGVLCNRGNLKQIGDKVEKCISLLDFPLESWPAKSCPLCAKKVPINRELGHGAKFLARQKK